jgi:hypothetical protein
MPQWLDARCSWVVTKVHRLVCINIKYLFSCFQADAATWHLHRLGCCSWSRPTWQPRPLVVSPSSSVTPVSAWPLTASATERMTAATSRTNRDTARVSKMSLLSVSLVSDYLPESLYGGYFFPKQRSFSDVVPTTYAAYCAHRPNPEFLLSVPSSRRFFDGEVVRHLSWYELLRNIVILFVNSRDFFRWALYLTSLLAF